MDSGHAAIVRRRFKFFDTLPPEVGQTLLDVAVMSEPDRGQRVYERGSAADHVYLVALGVVRLVVVASGGRRVLAHVYAGDLFGEAGLEPNGVHGEEALGLEPALVCAVPAGELRRLMAEVPQLGVEVTRLIGRRLRGMRARVEQLGAARAEARVAHLLLMLARERGTDVDGRIVIPLRLSQADLADLVGLRRETVNIVLQDLRRRGVVEAQRHCIRVPDLDTLAALA